MNNDLSNEGRQPGGAADRSEGGSFYGHRDSETNSGNVIGVLAGLAGVGVGILAMYFFDPDRGPRRRSIVNNKLSSARHRIPRAARVTARDVSNRVRGAFAEASHRFYSDDATDPVVEARVRSKLGRVCSHPHSVHVTARDGRVTLDGVILAPEVSDVLKCVNSVRGVTEVDNRLREYDTAEGIPSLQGGSYREPRSEFMQQNWSPAARLAAGTAGTAALAYGLAKRDLLGVGLGTAGVALLGRSISNTEFQRMFGLGGGQTAVTIDKAINVDAPPDVLYALWSNFENFPQFMSNVLEVKNVNKRVSHWKVAGPAEVPIEWDSEITKVVPNEMIAWKSLEGSPFANAGYVLFQPNGNGGTEVAVRISYNPPGGAVGHAIAKAFGADPKSEMDEDMLRMKTLLETGNLRRNAAQKINAASGSQQIH